MMRRTGALLGAACALALTNAAQAQTTVELWHVFNLETDMIHGGIEGFHAAQEEVSIEARVLPFAELRTELIRAIATGDVPDLVVMDNPVTASFAAQGALEDLSDLVAASAVVSAELYHPGPWSSVVWDGAIYGVPRASNTIALYYNADLFRAAGLDPDAPPSTWDALVTTAGMLTDEPGGVYGIAFSAVQSEEATFQWLPWLYQAGGSLEELDGEAAAAALQAWVNMVDNGYATRDVINMRQYEGTNTFIAGNAAMAISGPWELPRIDAEATFDWRVAKLPVREQGGVEASALGGFNWTVPAGAANREAAFAVIEYMASQEVLENAWATGRLPSRPDVVTEDPNWPEAYATFTAQLESARARGPHPDWPEISAAIQTAIQEALTGTKPVEAALADAAAKVKPILTRTPL